MRVNAARTKPMLRCAGFYKSRRRHSRRRYVSSRRKLCFAAVTAIFLRLVRRKPIPRNQGAILVLGFHDGQLDCEDLFSVVALGVKVRLIDRTSSVYEGASGVRQVTETVKTLRLVDSQVQATDPNTLVLVIDLQTTLLRPSILTVPRTRRPEVKSWTVVWHSGLTRFDWAELRWIAKASKGVVKMLWFQIGILSSVQVSNINKENASRSG